MSFSISPRHTRVAAGVMLLAGLASGMHFLTQSARAADAPTDKPKGPPPVLVTLAEVKAQDVGIYRAGVGTVTPAQTVTVKARIDGQLDAVGFTEGQDVKAGQLLAQIDPRTLQAQLAQAQAQRAKDAALLENAKLDLQRYSNLIEQDAATRQQFDTQKAQVAQLDAVVKADEAQVNFAQVQLSFTKITAPISGRVGARLVDPGNIVHAADPGGLVVINQVDPVSVVFTLPEEAVGEIREAQQSGHAGLTVQAFARDGRTALGQGRLILMNNQIDVASGTIQLKASFPNPKRLLWPGQYVNVRLVLGGHKQSLTVPDSAVQRGQSGPYAYVANADNTVRNQPIRVAQIQDGLAVIDAGLKAGERVVTDGHYKLSPGARITVGKPANKAGKDAAAGAPGAASKPEMPSAGASK